MSSQGIYKRSPDASVTSVGERVVLYHRVSRTAVVLNPTGSWIWGQLESPRAPSDLVRELRGKFPELSEADAERDVSAFLAELTQHAMVAVGS
jgi:hypothetical protein